MDGRIGICFGGIGHGLLDPFFIVVTVNLVAVVVNERWISVDYDALVAGMFDDFFVSFWARGRSESALPHEAGSLLKFVSSIGVLFDGFVRVRFWSSKHR